MAHSCQRALTPAALLLQTENAGTRRARQTAAPRDAILSGSCSRPGYGDTGGGGAMGTGMWAPVTSMSCSA